MHIDLGKKSDSCCGEVATPSKKKEIYYPSNYIDGLKGSPVSKDMMEKDITVEMVIRIKSAKLNIEKGKDPTTDLNYEMKSVDFNPGGKKKKSAADGDSIHEAIVEELS